MWKFIKSNNWLWLAFTIILAFAGSQLFWITYLGDPDAYYHAKVSQLLVSGQLGSTFPWLAFTTWADRFADQHYFFHVLLYPFATIERMPWAIILFSSAAIITFVFTLRQLQVRWLPVWVLICLVGSADFLFRLNLVKGNSLSLVLLCVSVILILKKRYLWLVPVAFLFSWTYGGFVFLPVMAGIYSLSESWLQKKLVWQPVIFSLVGIVLGILLHPQGASLPAHLYSQIFQAGLGAGSGVEVGVEWDAYNWKYFLTSNALVVAVWLIATIDLIWYRLKNRPAVWLWITSLLGLVLTLQSRRFIEYWVPFALIFAAAQLSPYLAKLTWVNFKSAWQEWEFKLAVLIFVLAVLGSGNVIYENLKLVDGYFRQAPAGDLYREASSWLIQHSQPGEIVFNTQWDQFPQLFYWNPHNRYIIGMDPGFMYLNSPEDYWQWRRVADDRTEWGSAESLYNILQNDFQAKYLFVEHERNPRLQEFLKDDFKARALFTQVYTDGRVSIYSRE